VDQSIVVGLGNPGTEYEATRHNVGFKVVDELAQRFRLRMKVGHGEYVDASRRITGTDLVLVKPLTYMNNSGTAVGEVLERYSARLEELIVVADDFALPLGTIRVRAQGSDGGHNGLSSIIYVLNSKEFARIRCGIRRDLMPPKERLAEFVLSPFEPEERVVVDAMVTRAADAVMEFASSGIARTMNRFNTQSKPT
jgi:peptidyl-tRNA hydrolase, PTH1 family